MDPLRSYELQYRVQHRHGDGTWSEMTADASHHDAADHDVERSWAKRLVFRCSRCDETVTLGPSSDGDEAGDQR